MKKIRLGEICDLKSGYAFKASDYVDFSNTLNCRMSNIRPGAIFDINYNIKYLPDEYADKYKEFLLHDDDIIIAMTDLAGDPKILGVPAKVITNGYSILQNQRVGKLIIKEKSKVNFDFLKYALSNPRNKEYYKKFAGGGLQINISNKDILNVQIPLYEIQEQIEISNKLDKVDKLIDTRKKQIEELDKLINSQFVEMFMKKDFQKEKLFNNVQEMFIGPFGSALKKECFVEKSSGYCVVYEQKHAINKKINDFRWVDENKYNSLKRFNIQAGDIIVSCRGTIGKTYVIPEDAPLGIMHPSIMKIRLKREKYIPEFFEKILEYYLMENENQTNGATIKMGIKASVLENEEFIIPNIELQKEYLKITKLVDKQKFKIQKSLEEIQKLQESLMNEYFGG
jgi:restriction endonuclease S subunit